ncbi:MAG: DEAD/DEAH box helicase [Eubacteriales bacterium]|nr:DEAD/DEAH box helicase [Eubacteriales bacterium]
MGETKAAQNKIVQFYISQYEMQARRKGARPLKFADFDGRVKRVASSLRRAKPSRISNTALEDYHRQLKNITVYAVLKNRRDVVENVKRVMIPKLVSLDMALLLPSQREDIGEDCLAFLKRELPGRICTQTLFELYPRYRQYRLKEQILKLVPSRPELEFPEALQMERRFILHIGPTNSGKTFSSLERLKTARHGIYLGPLRLLALEVYEKMKEYHVPCTMLTGQECIEEKNSLVTASTVEMADFEDEYDIAVIDEAQMMADPERGHAWTKAILGIRAREIHVCASPAAEQVLKHLIGLCGDTWEIHAYERKTKLVCEDQPFAFPTDIRHGDALIVFSKKSVLDVAGRMEKSHTEASVIYGSLPPEIRRRQMKLFTGGKTKVVVATDAIGMGLNLPVRRIVFLQTEKFDGTQRRRLTASEIKQIAGRAGRFGIYDTGYITAADADSLAYVREHYQAGEAPLKKVSLGFPQVLLDIEEPLDAILKVWNSVVPSEPFEKENIDGALFLYERAKKVQDKIQGFEDKHLLYKMITCPIDVKDWRVVAQWLEYCKTYSADISLSKPHLKRREHGGLMEYETYYKQLDLYYQFSRRMGKIIDEVWLKKEREKTESIIMRYLTKEKSDYIARCAYCGRLLPLGYPFRVCEQCHAEEDEH